MLVLLNPDAGVYASVDANGTLVTMEDGGSPATYRSLDALQTSNTINFFTGQVTDQDRGNLEIHVGYRLEEGGEIYFNAQAITLRVD